MTLNIVNHDPEKHAPCLAKNPRDIHACKAIETDSTNIMHITASDGLSLHSWNFHLASTDNNNNNITPYMSSSDNTRQRMEDAGAD
jgi:hypothetical protein